MNPKYKIRDYDLIRTMLDGLSDEDIRFDERFRALRFRALFNVRVGHSDGEFMATVGGLSDEDLVHLAHAAEASRARSSAVSANHQRVPRGFMVDLCMPPERAEDVVYNLLDCYERWVERHGPRKARIIFETQAFGVIFSFWGDWVRQRAKLLWLLLWLLLMG